MSVAGYVLAGGNSTRMGKDKALLQIDGIALVQHAATQVRVAAGIVVIVGDPLKYGALGFPVIPDLRTGCGPLAGMEAALSHSRSNWNLVVACDMGSLKAHFLESLCAQARVLPELANCLVPTGEDQRLQPLSGVYHRRCLAAISAALNSGIRKVTEVVLSLNPHTWQAPDPHVFQNINTPEEWNRYVNGRTHNL